MTTSIIKIAMMALFAIGLSITACGDKSKNSTDGEQVASLGKEYTAAYVCPMHCEGSGSDQAGTCPVCGMDYVANNTAACPMHDEITGIKGDKCSKCGMALTPMNGEDHKGHNH